jgi:predicted RNA-binding protein with PIN domain
MATQYRFKTIMVTDSDRIEFSTLRDSFGDVRVTDKELFTAMFQLVDKAKLRKVVSEQKQKSTEQRELEKIKKLEQKLKEKLEKLQTNNEQPKTEKKEKVS